MQFTLGKNSCEFLVNVQLLPMLTDYWFLFKGLLLSCDSLCGLTPFKKLVKGENGSKGVTV